MAIVTEQVEKTHCHRCRGKSGKETFFYMSGKYKYDVDRAREIVSDGREPVEVEEDSVRASVAECDLDEFHLPHVDPTIPGIIAHIHYPTSHGRIVKAFVLIDGHHRAARCLKDGLPYHAYLLDEEESVAILLRKPGDLAQEAVPVRAAPARDLHEETTAAYEAKFQESRPLAKRARKVVAGKVSHDRRAFSPFEVYIARAEGACKWDVSGQKLIDYAMGDGALLCGHGFKPVLDAVARQLALGTHFSACHEAEVRWAELVAQLIPSAEKVRFTGSGTEAVMLAFRLARAYTGRDIILRLKDHYHGWHDEAMAHFYDPVNAGLNRNAIANVCLGDPAEPDEIVKYLQERRTAAVILEPVGGASGGIPCHPEFLQTLREATKKTGTLLIFDEVASGFRYSPGGVQQVTGIRPDLTVLGKILGGGLPAGALAGRDKYMGVFGGASGRHSRSVHVPHTGSASANPLSAAAGAAMLEHIADGKAQQRATAAAARLVQEVNGAADAGGVDVHLFANNSSAFHVLIGAYARGCTLGPSPAVSRLYTAHPERYALLRRALLVEGIDVPAGRGWVSSTHDGEIIAETVQAFARVFRRLQNVDGFRR